MWLFFWAVIISALVLSLVVVDTTQELIVVEEDTVGKVVVKETFVSPYDDRAIIRRLQNLFQLLNVQHVVVWGHPLHSHTHSYIHEAFAAAAERSGIHTIWTNTAENCPVDNTVFITEGQVMEDMPASPKSWYMLHNCDKKPKNVPDNRITILQFYTYNCETKSWPMFDKFQRVCHDGSCVYMPWGTNILPHQDQFSHFLSKPNGDNTRVRIVGQSGDLYGVNIDKFVQALPNGMNERKASLPQDEMITYLREGDVAPALLNNWQKEHGYIPCRIMKNISYGRLGVTTSFTSHYMLHYHTIFAQDETELAYKWNDISEQDAKSKFTTSKQLVMERHTYLNRLELLLANLWARNTHVKNRTSIVHLTCHTGRIRHVDYVASQLHWDVTHVNLLTQEGASVHNMGTEMAYRLWQKYETLLNATDCVITSDTAPVARIILHNLPKFKGKLLVWVCNRFDYTETQDTLEAQVNNQEPWRNMLRDVTSNHSDQVRVVSYTKLERAYALQKGLCWDGPFADTVLKPVGNHVSTTPLLESGIPDYVQREKSKYLFIPPYLNDEKAVDYKYLDTHNIMYYRGRYMGPEDLKGFKAILHIPYAPSNLALFENLTRGIVYYLPSLEFLRELLSPHGNWFSGGLDNAEYSEWYDPFMSELFVYFDSWDDLKEKLAANAHIPLEEKTRRWAARETQQTLKQWEMLTTVWW